MIDRIRWQQLSRLLDDALELQGDARAAFVSDLRVVDAELAAQLARMLDATQQRAAEAAPGLPAFALHLGQALAASSVEGEARGSGHARQVGQRLGAWELLAKIGEGGMGQVWLARRCDGLYEARAAIKLLRDDLAAAGGGGPFGTSGLAGRFARERAVLARLNHPLIGRLLDAGVAGNQAYLVLEYVDGSSLAEHARAHCPTVAQRVRLLVQIAEAVDYAHAQLIVHRDLKPSNVLVDQAGRPKLLDFGIAGLIDDGQPVDTDLTRQTGRGLTLAYAAPEQILGSPIGVAADVFSLGVMLFELLSGELPFAPRHTPRLAIERAVLHDEPRRLGSLAAVAGSLQRRGGPATPLPPTAGTAPPPRTRGPRPADPTLRPGRRSRRRPAPRRTMIRPAPGARPTSSGCAATSRRWSTRPCARTPPNAM